MPQTYPQHTKIKITKIGKEPSTVEGLKVHLLGVQMPKSDTTSAKLIQDVE